MLSSSPAALLLAASLVAPLGPKGTSPARVAKPRIAVRYESAQGVSLFREEPKGDEVVWSEVKYGARTPGNSFFEPGPGTNYLPPGYLVRGGPDWKIERWTDNPGGMLVRIPSEAATPAPKPTEVAKPVSETSTSKPEEKPVAPLPSARELPASYKDSVLPLPAEFRGKLIYLKLEFGGKPIRFLLDSGAPTSGIEKSVADGLREGKELKIPGVPGSLEADVQPVEKRAMPQLSTPVDGYLGADFMARHRFVVDYAAERIWIVRRGEIDAEFLSSVFPATPKRIEVRRREDQRYDIDSSTGPMAFDTGAGGVMIRSDRYDLGAVAYPPQSATLWIGKWTVGALMMPKLEMGGIPMTNVVALSSYVPHGVVGSHVLTDRRMVIDLGGGSVFVEPPHSHRIAGLTISEVARTDLRVTEKSLDVVLPDGQIIAVLKIGDIEADTVLTWLRDPAKAKELADLAEAQGKQFRITCRAPDGTVTTLTYD